MTYPAIDTRETRAVGDAPDARPAAQTARERLHVVLMLAGLLSLTAMFWIAVFRLAIV